MKRILNAKSFLSGLLTAGIFAVFTLTAAFSAPVVIIPGEGQGISTTQSTTQRPVGLLRRQKRDWATSA